MCSMMQAASESSLSSSESASVVMLVSPDLIAVRLIALGVVGVVSPIDVPSCIGVPKQLRVQQPAIVPVFSLYVESAFAEWVI